MKLTANINAANKCAYVTIDGSNEVRCPIRKESSGHYTITLTGHVEGWPKKYLSIGKELTDMVIEKDDSEYNALSTKPAVRFTGSNTLSAILERTINQVAASDDVTDEEANNVARVLTPIIQRLKTREADSKLDAQIKALQDQLALLVAQRTQTEATPSEAPVVDDTEFHEARVKARAKKVLSE